MSTTRSPTNASCRPAGLVGAVSSGISPHAPVRMSKVRIPRSESCTESIAMRPDDEIVDAATT